MKAIICIFIFCLVIAFSLCTSSLPTVEEAKHQPNASKGIPREPGIPDSGQPATEDDRLSFESIIALHNTYFVVLIAAFSVYFGIVGACWKFAFETNRKASVPRLLLLAIPVLVGFAVFEGMRYALSGCTARQKYLDDFAAKLDISSIDLSLLRHSVIVSMVVIVILIVASLYLCVWKCLKKG